MSSFFLSRASGLHTLYPLTKLTIAMAIVTVGFLARAPHVPLALFCFLILPLAMWGHIARELIRVIVAIILPFILSIVLVQGLFYPGATRVIFSFGLLALKAEGLEFAYGTTARILLLAGTGLLLLFSTHPADLALALTRRGMPNTFAYIIVAGLNLIPQMQTKATAILDAQRSRGMETEGTWVKRVRAIIPLLSPLVLSALADVDERAMALEARAFSAHRPKTSFKELRDTHAQFIARRIILLSAVIVGVIEVWYR